MGTNSDKFRELRKNTQQKAAAFVEDFAHMKEVLSRATINSGEIRRLSAIMRRLLNERVLAEIANCRIGRLSFRMPDNIPVYMKAKKSPPICFCSGGAVVYGIEIRAVLVERASVPMKLGQEFDPTRSVDVNIESFLRQNVLCIEGAWASRGDVIKYVAHVAGGVHSGVEKTPQDITITNFKDRVRFLDAGCGLGIDVDLSPIPKNVATWDWDPKALNAVLFELFCAAHFLCNSPDVTKLQQTIIEELLAGHHQG